MTTRKYSRRMMLSSTAIAGAYRTYDFDVTDFLTYGAKNTLVKNYLYFAEKRGAQVTPERTVVDIRPLGAGDGSDGYEVESVRSGAWLHKDRRVQRAPPVPGRPARPRANQDRAQRSRSPECSRSECLRVPCESVRTIETAPLRRHR